MARSKSKQKSKPVSVDDRMEQEEDLAMSEEEMYRIIRETGIMGEAAGTSAGNNSDSSMPMQPADLQDGRFEEIADSAGEEPDDEEQVVFASTASKIAPRKLVELIDEDESLPQPLLAREATSDSTLIPLTLESIEEDETFRIVLWMVVFSTLWLCLCVECFFSPHFCERLHAQVAL